MASAEKAKGLDAPLTGDGPQKFSINTEFWEMFGMGWPMVVSFFCRLGMASTDAAFCGHITTGGHSPGVYLAAATLSDMVTNILTAPPLAFSSGLNALVSQAMGSGNKKLAGVWLQLSVVYLGVTYIPALVSMFYVEDILLKMNFPEDIASLAGEYAKWNVFWPVPNGWYQCMRFYFQAQCITRPAMYNNMFFLIANICFNYFFVFYCGFGFVGAAMSISLSRCLQPVFYWIYMFAYRKAHLEAGAWTPWSWATFNKSRRTALYDQAIPQIGTLLFQSTTEQITTLLIASLGTLAVAASSAVQSLTMIWTISLAAALPAVCGVRVGFHLGSGNGEAAKRAALLVTQVTFFGVLFFGGITVAMGQNGLSVMTSDPDVKRVAVTLLLPVCVGAFPMTVVQNMSGGCFTSQGRTRLATYITLGFALPMTIGSVGFAVYFFKNLTAVFWGQALAFTGQAVVVMFFFYRSDWDACVKEAAARQEMSPSPGGVDAVPLAMATPGALGNFHLEMTPKTTMPMNWAMTSPGNTGQTSNSVAVDVP